VGVNKNIHLKLELIMTRDLNKEIIFERKVENSVEGSLSACGGGGGDANGGPDSLITSEEIVIEQKRGHEIASSSKIPIKRPSFIPTRHSLRAKRKELKKHLTVMATAKFVEKGQHPSSSSSTAPVSVSSHISPATTNVPLDQNQIVITTSEKLSAGDPHTSLLEQQPTPLNGGSRPMSRTDSVKNFFQ